MTEADHPLLAGLTLEQRDAVTTGASPLCIIAGAGSGKTRVLTRRIAWQASQGNADPRRTLAVTFTRRAARELRARLRRLGLNDEVRAGTFHAVALAQLRRHAADSGHRPPRILENAAGLIAELRPKADRAAGVDIVNEIGWCQARLVLPEEYPAEARSAGRRPPWGRADRFAQLYADYESAKRRRRVLDFDDMLSRSLELMATDPKQAAAHRWLHQHVLVDEFQDINPLQFALLRSWLGPDSTLVVVGDPDQAIYGWN
ncbi:MAG: AAA family ATPase, partial [Acidimicrobiaceae bacterium]|nr:AAA family ATPase [Acidimicrobiaceae bacterium]